MIKIMRRIMPAVRVGAVSAFYSVFALIAFPVCSFGATCEQFPMFDQVGQDLTVGSIGNINGGGGVNPGRIVSIDQNWAVGACTYPTTTAKAPFVTVWGSVGSTVQGKVSKSMGSSGCSGTYHKIGSKNFNVIRISCCAPLTVTAKPRYGLDGLTECYIPKQDDLSCNLTEELADDVSPCCSNGLKDGMEWALDKGGACENLEQVCPFGGEIISVGWSKICAVARTDPTENASESACLAASGANIWANGQCYANIGGPVYAGPEGPNPGDSSDSLEATNKTNQILIDSVNALKDSSAKIVAAVNTNTDVANTNSKSIIAAIVDSKSAIVAAINANSTPAPVVNVAAPIVNVAAPVVNVDTSSIVSAVNASSGKLDQTLGKMDTQTGIFNGVKATLDQHLATAQAARDDAAAASGQSIIRADAANTKLDQTLGKMDQTLGKMDAQTGELNGIKLTLDQHLLAAQASRDSAASSLIKLDGIKAAIEAAPPGGGSDMTATNAKLDGIKDSLNPGGVQFTAPTAPGSFGSRFSTLKDTLLDRYDGMVGTVTSSGAFGSLQQLLGSVPTGGGSTSLAINAGSYGTIDFDFSWMGNALAILALFFKALFSVICIRIVLLKGG